MIQTIILLWNADSVSTFYYFIDIWKGLVYSFNFDAFVHGYFGGSWNNQDSLGNSNHGPKQIIKQPSFDPNKGYFSPFISF